MHGRWPASWRRARPRAERGARQRRRAMAAPRVGRRAARRAGGRAGPPSQPGPGAGRRRGEAELVMRVIAVLDPLAPLCWRGVALWPNGIGTALAAAQENDPDTVAGIEDIITREETSNWAALRADRCDLAVLRAEARQQHSWLQQRAQGGGTRRRSRPKAARWSGSRRPARCRPPRHRARCDRRRSGAASVHGRRDASVGARRHVARAGGRPRRGGGSGPGSGLSGGHRSHPAGVGPRRRHRRRRHGSMASVLAAMGHRVSGSDLKDSVALERFGPRASPSTSVTTPRTSVTSTPSRSRPPSPPATWRCGPRRSGGSRSSAGPRSSPRIAARRRTSIPRSVAARQPPLPGGDGGRDRDSTVTNVRGVVTDVDGDALGPRLARGR